VANKTLFGTIRSFFAPAADARNQAGGLAYAMTPRHALAQLAATGCFNGTYYVSAQDQLDRVIALAGQVDSAFLAKAAVYAREQGRMKDMPAALCAVLATLDGEALERVFPRVIDTPKMLRNFVQIVRSGVAGRKSLGSRPKRLVRAWLDRRTDVEIFEASVGNDPSLADVIRMVHPRPKTESRRALYAYLIGKPHRAEHLPEVVRAYEAFKATLAPKPA
jgi:60 kDa SS-A/Ro ribonucleoprotein